MRYPIIEDAEEYFRILTEGNFEYYYATIPENVEMEIKWIERCKFKRDNNFQYNYSVLYNNNLVGGCGISIFQDSPHIGEIGYFIDRNFFNKGIASEAVKKLEKIAFDELGLIRLEIRMDPRNKSSERVAIKNNFEREGFLKKVLKFGENYYDNLIFSKTR